MNGVITLILMTTIMTVNIGKAKMLRNKERREWKFTFKYWDLKAAYDELRTRFGRKAEDDGSCKGTVHQDPHADHERQHTE